MSDTSFTARAHDLLWRLTPGGVHRRLRTWRPVQVDGRTFRIPLLGGRHVAFDRLKVRWRRELMGNVMPKDGGYFVDVGARMGEALIDMQCAAPMSRYVGFEPCVDRADYVNQLIRLNGIADWQVVPVALTSESTVLQLPPDARSQLAAGLIFDSIRPSVASAPVRLVHIRTGGSEASVLGGMRATLAGDRPVLLCEVRFAGTERDLEHERNRKEALQEILAEQDYVILQLVINGMGDIVGAARMDEFPLGVASAANRLQRDYIMVPREELGRLRRTLY